MTFVREVMVLWHFFFSPGPPPLTGAPRTGGGPHARSSGLRSSESLGTGRLSPWAGLASAGCWFGLGLAGFCSGSGLDFGLIFGWISASGFHVLGFWLDFGWISVRISGRILHFHLLGFRFAFGWISA